MTHKSNTIKTQYTDYIYARDKCSNGHNHTPCPSGYLQWHRWADKKEKTHKQTKCPQCGFLTIWVEK